MSSTNVLSERCSNIPVSPEKKDAKDSKEAPKSLEYHRQMLESRLKGEKLVPDISLQSSSSTNATTTTTTTTTNSSGAGAGVAKVAHAYRFLPLSSAEKAYVSPSDTIQSPATQKLAAFRTKHLKAAKPRSLFAKTTTKNAGDLASTSTSTNSSQDNN
ncbi:hypothetical protein E6O75_ATG09125 [Venturia nashicola]|uniref:Spo12-like protein n=1 Tax=Venturia nashicola TaxID=86259 RepID=A0A4Z1NSB4_9PEZI|nr:hypothetical protein E6O75_ATG09125 [Venturia nashicola]